MTKNACLPKISILLQFGGEILALLCSDDSIQTLVILPWFLTLGTEVKLEGFVLSHQSVKVPIFHPKLQQDADFWQESIFRHGLSEYPIKSYNFTNLFFVTSSL